MGAAVAFQLVSRGIADELILIDTNEGLARAEQLDLQDMQGRIDTRTIIKINDYSELADTDILFITAGNILAYKEKQAQGNRWAEFKYTKDIVQDIAPKVKASGFHGVAIDTMNPCDAITQYFQENTGLSRQQVLQPERSLTRRGCKKWYPINSIVIRKTFPAMYMANMANRNSPRGQRFA
ncbi:L-lactate dehydrogenase [Sporolactobacillus inulinus]|uniref:L-lactate dehydrogenase n=1 Tax=Sporolactobacillus inulinus TaxID=2078 RepID=A0A4Y1ZD33_9BACL|nr:hypothetical protein [Sporolactobacillus inulinus]GAY76873.1 L-lactate dehydrogenase [Sporolactobacillus inulinus]